MSSISCWQIRLVRPIALMLLAVLATTVHAQASPHLVVNTHRLNIRSGPGVSFDILTSVAGGTQLPVTGKDSGGLWYQISSDVGTGWVNTHYTLGRGNFSSVPTIGAQGVIQPSPTIEIPFGAPHFVVNVSYLNIRSGPGVGYDVVLTVKGGTKLPATGRDPGGVWYQVSTGAGTGWLNSTYAVGRGNFSSVPTIRDGVAVDTSATPVEIAPGAPHLVVNTGRLNIRTGPGLGYDVLTSVSGGTKLPVIAVDSGRLWYQVMSSAGTGWVNSYYAVGRGNFSSVPTFGVVEVEVPAITDPNTPRLVINTHRLNVRSGPGVGHPVITSVRGGTELPVVSIHPDRLWYEVTTSAGNGWVNSYYAVTRGNFSRLRSHEPVETAPHLTGPTPRAVVNTHRLNIRSGPGAAHGVVTSVRGGTTLAVLGISRNRGWYQVEGSFGQGWLNNDFVVFRGDFSRVAVTG